MSPKCNPVKKGVVTLSAFYHTINICKSVMQVDIKVYAPDDKAAKVTKPKISNGRSEETIKKQPGLFFSIFI